MVTGVKTCALPIYKKRLKERMGRVEEPYMDQVDHALSISFGLEPVKNHGAT